MPLNSSPSGMLIFRRSPGDSGNPQPGDTHTQLKRKLYSQRYPVDRSLLGDTIYFETFAE
jgi:hypothetical protein